MGPSGPDHRGRAAAMPRPGNIHVFVGYLRLITERERPRYRVRTSMEDFHVYRPDVTYGLLRRLGLTTVVGNPVYTRVS